MSSNKKTTTLFLALAVLTAPASALAKELTVGDALAMAIAKSPALEAATLEVKRARLQIASEEHRYVPELSATVGYQHSENPTLQAGAVNVGGGDDVFLDAGVSYTFPFGTRLGLDVGFDRSHRSFVEPDRMDVVDLDPGYGTQARLSLTQPLLRGFGTGRG